MREPRPYGHPRSGKVYYATLDYCYGQTGLSRNDADTQAFKDCVKGRGDVPDPPRKTTSKTRAGTAAISIPKPARSATMLVLSTVHYTNEHGLNCTRTGLVSFCANF